MNNTEEQILKNQMSIISALETLLINTGRDVSSSYENLSKNFIDTLVLLDYKNREETKDVNKQ